MSCLYVAMFVVMDKNKRLKDAENYLVYSLQNQLNILTNWSEDRAAEIRLFAKSSAAKELNIDTMASRLKFYHNHLEQLGSLVFLDKNGFVKIDTATENIVMENSTISLRDRTYFQAGLKGEDYIHDIVTAKSSGQQTIIFSSPIFSNKDEFQGLIFGAVRLDILKELLRESIKGDTAEVLIIDQEGEIISHVSNETKESIVNNKTIPDELFNSLQQNDQSMITYKDETGMETLAVVTELFSGRYYIVNQIQQREILDPHTQIVSLMVLIGVFIIIIAAVLVIPISQQLLRPFVSIVQAIKRVKKGQYKTQINLKNYKSSPKEVKLVINSFNEMVRAIHENKYTLKNLSNTDDLTGLANRRYFETYLSEQWQKALEQHTPISLIFADIDYFKHINDQFGHLTGDSCLIQVAGVMKSLFEKEGYFIARYGGEEFVIAMPKTTLENAEKTAEDIRYQVKQLQIRRSKDNPNLVMTISLGIATMTPNKNNIKEDLIQLADQALYEAKSNGRNQVISKEK